MSTNVGYGARAPAVIYSCLIQNKSDAEISVQIEFIGIADHHHEVVDIKIAQGEEQLIDEKEFEHGGPHTKYRKVVDLVRVKKYDGTTLELKNPFHGVNSPKKNWIFEINNDSLKSVNPEKK